MTAPLSVCPKCGLEGRPETYQQGGRTYRRFYHAQGQRCYAGRDKEDRKVRRLTRQQRKRREAPLLEDDEAEFMKALRVVDEEPREEDRELGSTSYPVRHYTRPYSVEEALDRALAQKFNLPLNAVRAMMDPNVSPRDLNRIFMQLLKRRMYEGLLQQFGLTQEPRKERVVKLVIDGASLAEREDKEEAEELELYNQLFQ